MGRRRWSWRGRFERVMGVDPSAAQIASATPNARVEYRVGAAEATGVENGSRGFGDRGAGVSLVPTTRAFFRGGAADLGPGGRAVLVFGYGLAAITPELDAAVVRVLRGNAGTVTGSRSGG